MMEIGVLGRRRWVGKETTFLSYRVTRDFSDQILEPPRRNFCCGI